MRLINEAMGLERCARATNVHTASGVLNGGFMSAENGTGFEDFCNLWKRDVFAFCRMFLGNGPAAEEAACQAFVEFRRAWDRSSYQDGIPFSLMRSALRASERVANGQFPRDRETSPLERAMQGLPHKERAIVIMRNILRMDWQRMALATQLSPERVHETWRLGLGQLNALLQTDSSKERY